MNKKKIFQEILELILVVLLALSVRFYVVSLFRVYGPSMCDTLNKIEDVRAARRTRRRRPARETRNLVGPGGENQAEPRVRSAAALAAANRCRKK